MQTKPDESEDQAAVGAAFDALHAELGGGRLVDALTRLRAEHVPGILAGHAAGLPGLQDLEQALAQRAVPRSDLRVYSGRNALDLEHARIARNGEIELQMLANAALVGSTFMIRDAQRHMPKAHQLARRLEGWFGDAVEFTLLASFGAKSGLATHHDSYHMLIIQLEGTRAWTLFGDAAEPGLGARPGDESGEQRQVTMQPGDVLILPAGQRHFCAAGGYSLHVAAMIIDRSGKLLRARIEKTLAESAVLREPMLQILGPKHQAAMVQKYRAHLHDLIEHLDIEAILASERERRKVPQQFTLGHKPITSAFEV